MKCAQNSRCTSSICHFAKYEYKGIKTFGVTDTQTRHPKSDADGQTEGRMDGGS